jgi:perosamine synthetase
MVVIRAAARHGAEAMPNMPSTLPVWRFDPTPCNFPRPHVPVLPPLRGAALRWSARRVPAEVRHFSRGRYALHAAYRAAGVGPMGSLLAPSYHCRTMLDPAQRLSAEVVLYPLTPGLAPDMDGLRATLRSARTPPKALLMTHYFGLPQDVAPVRALCDAHGVVLIEDCSHALAPDAGSALGRGGHLAVSSPYKFFPCPDGGLLWRNGTGPALPPQAPAPGLKSQLRALRQAWPGTALGDQATHSANVNTQGVAWTEEAAGLSAEYSVSDENIGSTLAARWIQAHVDIASVRDARRARYMQWVQAVAGLRRARALLPSLPQGCTPYMFPLLVDDPDASFYPLKHGGVPIWRWDDMAVSTCAVAQRYRQGVFHLPCHQGLSEEQMHWQLSQVLEVLGKS